MSKRTKIITLVLLAVAVIFGIALIARAPRPSPAPVGAGNTNPPEGDVSLPLVGGSVAVPVSPPLTKDPKTQSTLEAIAKTFAERYGSYSSQSGVSALDQLRPIMTERLFTSARPALQRTLPATGFYGVTTKVLSTEIVALNGAETEVQVVVQTMRSETRAGNGVQQFYQKLTVSLLKDPTGWKVDQATWQ